MKEELSPIGIFALIQPFLFLIAPETAHHLGLKTVQIAGSISLTQTLTRFLFAPKNDPIQLFGKELPNRVGLAAGYDKHALALDGLEAMGFGHIEIGTITPRPQAGNPYPRIHRHPKEYALVNRMGFPSEGLDVVAKRIEAYLSRREKRNSERKIPALGINIGKNKITPNEEAHKDYLACFRRLTDFADYITVNISSPNTPNLRALQHNQALEKLLLPLLNERSKRRVHTPIMVKLSPDLSTEHRLQTLHLLVELGIEGVILSNTRKTQMPWQGGLSGLLLRDETLAIIKQAKRETPQLKIFASGGIGLDGDVALFAEAGADLVQVYTALIYRGPALLKRL